MEFTKENTLNLMNEINHYMIDIRNTIENADELNGEDSIYIFATKWTIHDSASLYSNSSIVVGVYKGFWNVKKIEEWWNFIYVLKK